jgi:inosine-uridine nucleoside N-ribohydrolase
MTRLVIDTDTAGDDVTSLLFGLRWPGVELEAITVVAGNVYLDQCVQNALYTCEVADRPDIPVYAGADRPLLRELVTAHNVHGEDGMGNSGFPRAKKEAEREHAVDALVELADRHAGELEIIAQGPLTNLALALRKDPALPEKVRRLWIMGGANNSLGNITPAAEFNFYVDPEAAHMVLIAGFRTVLVPWDVCVNDGILLREELASIIEMKTKLSEFYLTVNRAIWEFVRDKMGIDGISNPDPLTIAMAIDEGLILERGNYFVDCEYQSELTRGYSVVDLLSVTGNAPNCDVVLKADKDGFLKMLTELLSG